MEPALYIHIPFCKSKCDYCDFYSKARSVVPDGYVAAVKNQIAFYKEKYAVSAWKSVYVGGGTPSMLRPGQLAALLSGLPVQDGAEITVEMNPDDITDDLLSAAEFSGVTRISVGIQALDDKVLGAVHRRCTRRTSVTALKKLRRRWKKQLSVDMIAGLPLQTMASFIKGLKKVLSFGPDHVSLYSLTVEDDTPLARALRQGKLAACDPDEADAIWLAGRDLLVSAGLQQYEVSNFARPGFESRHNMVYWRLENYVGAGAGATGTLYGGCGENGRRWTNTTSIDRYISFWNSGALTNVTAGGLPETVETLSPAVQEFEYLMMGFRMLQGIDSDTFRARFDKDLGKRIGDFAGGVFAEWKEKKLAASWKTTDAAAGSAGASSAVAGPAGSVPAGRPAAVVPGNRANVHYALTAEGLLLLNQFLEVLIEEQVS